MTEGRKPSDTKASMPPVYRKRLVQAVLAWLVLCGLAAGALYLLVPARLADTASVTLDVVMPETGAPETAEGRTDEAGNNPPSAPVGEIGKIALVVTDLGLQADATSQIIEKFPPQVTLVFSPYTPDLDRWMQDVRAHEILAQLPMQPDFFPQDDPGPLALWLKFSDRQIENRLKELLARAPNAVGVINYMGSAFMNETPMMTRILTLLKERGLFMLEYNEAPTANIFTRRAAQESEALFISPNILLDTTPDEASIRKKLAQAEMQARDQGYAVVITSPIPVSVGLLGEWIGGLEKRGYRLVPMSEIARIAPRQKSDPTYIPLLKEAVPHENE